MTQPATAACRSARFGVVMVDRGFSDLHQWACIGSTMIRIGVNPNISGFRISSSLSNEPEKDPVSTTPKAPFPGVVYFSHNISFCLYQGQASFPAKVSQRIQSKSERPS